jgi:hypothetical protein
VTDVPFERIDPTADDPYEDIDVASLPDWWRDCLREFEEHDLHRYVPAQFEDGAVVRTVVEGLEVEHGVEVQLLRVGGGPGDDWTVRVDGESVGTVPRTRVRQKFSVVGVDSDAFRSLVRSALPGDADGDGNPEADGTTGTDDDPDPR